MAKKKRPGPTRPCPHCEKPVHPRTKTCPHCGGTIEAKKKKARRKKKAAVAKKPDDRVSMAALLEAKKLAAKVGSLEKAKEAINALAKLSE